MKDQDEIWIVIQNGASLDTAIRCTGKQQAKEIRKTMQDKHGGDWQQKKVTQKEIAAA